MNVFRDAFDNSGSGWDTGVSGDCESGYDALNGDGYFYVNIYTQNEVCIYPAPADNRPMAWCR
ncbi:MAG: hypothetical protein R2873_24770 [Caldilineaceae bacterium]